ncbi:MAG: c-type cytochrome [Salibacteraceae bacterium]
MRLKFSILLIIVSIAQSCIPTGRDYGKELYEEKCANCHGIEGNGLQQLYPPIKNSDYLIKNQEMLACMIRYGQEGAITVNGVGFNESMPAQPLLSDIDIYNIINYISKNIDSKIEPVHIQTINDQLLDCKN